MRSDRERLREERDDLVRRGRRGNVEILRLHAEQQVPDATSGKEGLMAGCAEALRDGQSGLELRVGLHSLEYPPVYTIKLLYLNSLLSRIYDAIYTFAY